MQQDSNKRRATSTRRPAARPGHAAPLGCAARLGRRDPVPRLSSIAGPRAFSLIELLIVLALIGLLAGIIVPRMEPAAQQQLDSAAQVLAADLAYARNLAVSNGSTYRIRFDLRRNRYVLVHAGSNAALDVIAGPAWSPRLDRPTRRVRDLAELPQTGLSLQLAAVEKGTTDSGEVHRVADLQFGPLGETTRPETTVVWLAAKRQGGRLFIPIQVAPVTGLVSVGQMQSEPPPTMQAVDNEEDEEDLDEEDWDEEDWDEEEEDQTPDEAEQEPFVWPDWDRTPETVAAEEQQMQDRQEERDQMDAEEPAEPEPPEEEMVEEPERGEESE